MVAFSCPGRQQEACSLRQVVGPENPELSWAPENIPKHPGQRQQRKLGRFVLAQSLWRRGISYSKPHSSGYDMRVTRLADNSDKTA